MGRAARSDGLSRVEPAARKRVGRATSAIRPLFPPGADRYTDGGSTNPVERALMLATANAAAFADLVFCALLVGAWWWNKKH